MNVALIATIFSFLCFIKSSSVNQVTSIFPDAEKTRRGSTIVPKVRTGGAAGSGGGC